jgi:hypothetical protein
MREDSRRRNYYKGADLQTEEVLPAELVDLVPIGRDAAPTGEHVVQRKEVRVLCVTVNYGLSPTY